MQETASDSVNDEKSFLEVENVRISPAKLVFCNVYVGKSLKREILIRNEGKSKVFINILQPNAKDIHVDAIPNGILIRPGVKLSKRVRISNIDPHCLEHIVPMYVNNHKINYELIVKLASSKISCMPISLDFGIIDEGVISAPRTLVLTNDGHSVTSFQVDMVKTRGHVIVEPNKGIVQVEMQETASDSVNDEKSFLEVENVRIFPAKLVFNDVYVGKSLKREILIRNEGKSKVFIKILQPNAKDIDIDAIPNGILIRPGVKLTKRVRINNIDPHCLKYIIPMCVNNHKINYEVIVKLASSKISCTPTSLNFGIIDEGVISAPRTLVLTNDGHSVTSFQVDMVKTRGHVIVEPNKGIVQPKSKIELKIRVIPLCKGQLYNSLVIKSEKPLMIPIASTVIIPKLEAIHPMASKHFTLIYFSPTYFALKSTQRLMIRNYSAVDCMFATEGEFYDDTMPLEQLSEKNPDIDEFSISPIDGIMQPQETKLFWITFAPKFKSSVINKSFYFSTVLIQKIRCKYLQDEIVGPNLYMKTPDASYSYRGSVLSVSTLCSLTAHRSVDYEASFLTEIEALAYYKSQAFSEKDMIRVHLCGEAEIPSVKIIPDELHLDDLRMQYNEIRVLELRNMSKHLPIIARYQKIPFVHLEKTQITLKALESKQITVTITPHKLGTISTKIVFDLMYHDQPKESGPKVIGNVSAKVVLRVKSITSCPKAQINTGLAPNYINEVGKHCQDLRFSSSFDNSKAITLCNKNHLNVNCNDLIALPNDRRRSLRPWRSNIVCCTIFTHQPRYIQPIDRAYERSKSEQDLRKKVTTYYNKYISINAQSKRKPPAVVLEDYTVTPQTKLWCADIACSMTEVETKKPPIPTYFIPLRPGQMNRIVVVPECIRTGAIAANHNVIFPVRIENWNEFPVRLYIRCDRANIGCIRENRYILDGLSCLQVKLVYVSGSIGYYAAILDLIVNESMMIPVPVLADVVPRILRLSSTQLDFDENHTRRYIEVTNSLNMPVRFYWVLDSTNFNVQPPDGTVEMGRTMRCVFYYLPEVEGPTQCIIMFISGESATQSVLLTAKKCNSRLEVISNEINFENLPLHNYCVRFPIIKNPCNFPVAFKIDISNLKASWINVFPMEATIQANSLFALAVSSKCTKCVVFEGIIKLVVKNTKEEYHLVVRGNVVYPDVRISPNTIYFQNIPSNTHDTILFTVTNHCPVITNIKFAMQNYAEFKITEACHYWSKETNGPFVFNPYEVRTFYIHFLPMDAICTCFYLPVIIDGILGPPIQEDQITQLVDYYLENGKGVDDDFQYISMPQKLPCVKVTAHSLEPKIIFSKRKIIFCAEGTHKKQSYRLKIKNPKHTTEVVYIKLDSLTDCFGYLIDETAVSLVLENTVKFNLEPHQETEITIIYVPTKFGKVKAFLPVYLGSEHANKRHTLIEVVGIYEKPEIAMNPRYIELIGAISGCITNKAMINTDDNYWFYCRPLPHCTPTYSLRLAVFKNHRPDCKLLCKFEGDVSMKISEGSEKTWTSKSDYTMDFRITNLPISTCIYTGFFEVSCSCGGNWKRPVIGACENSFLTTYSFANMHLRGTVPVGKQLKPESSTFLISMSKSTAVEEYPIFEFWHLFPLFPNADDDFSAFMEGCIRAVEMWVSTQGFFKEVYYNIPGSINGVCLKNVEDKRRRSRIVQEVDLPYLHLLHNMIGSQVNECLGVGEYPTNQIEQVYYVRSIFTNALELVKKHGGTLTYALGEFFLPFHFFDIFRTDLIARSVIPQPLAQWTETIEEFQLLAKQSWLDLLLQTYKVFYLYRLPIEKKSNVTYVRPLEEFFEALPNLCLRNPHIFNKHEQVIIAWFQFHYDQENTNIWSKTKKPVKIINIVGSSLTDGLVFAVVTSVYCPYLIPLLEKMYVHPETVEDNTHNLLTVIQSWEMINYSFDITADDMLKPNSLGLLMIMAYLYDILPSMFPEETMIFKAGLSVMVTKSLKLSNANDYPIAYKVIIIPENTEFIVNQDKLVIKPKKSVELKITYNAKFAKGSKCVLLLSGEVPKYHYAKNKCLSLVGIPDLSYASTVITHPAYHYEVQDLELTIQAPYTGASSYDLHQTLETVQSYQELEGLGTFTDITRFRNGRVAIINDVFITNNAGIMLVEGVIRTLFARDSSIFLYFSNSQLGDFMVRIDTKWYETNKSEDVLVTLPLEFCELPELYSERHRLTINIPLANNILWDTIKAMTCKLVKEEERAIWRNVLDMRAGRIIATRLYHLSRYLVPWMESDQDVYNLSTDNDCNILLPPKVRIRSEYEEGMVEIEWKLKSPHRWPNNFVMTLENKSLSKLRKYRIIFLCQHSSTSLQTKLH